MAQPQATLSHQHLRAICDEIGERLGYMLDRDLSEVPQRIRELLRLLELSDLIVVALVAPPS